MTPPHMNDHEQEKLAELIAIKVCEKYVLIMKDYVKKEVELHTLQCSVGKFTKALSVISAVICGCCVALFAWFIKKE